MLVVRSFLYGTILTGFLLSAPLAQADFSTASTNQASDSVRLSAVVLPEISACAPSTGLKDLGDQIRCKVISNLKYVVSLKDLKPPFPHSRGIVINDEFNAVGASNVKTFNQSQPAAQTDSTNPPIYANLILY